ncbi:MULTISPECIES: peptide ABC transporter substrate-binding protein [Arthrobacter]|uniref:ABC transporter substrate-binding protein n=1 Tax=Arthrobacter psychrochitiniphilus TaxID=291045 RepID=A0A2V3DN01_9MICC|nr:MULTISPECIES: ABC transporter substrate-binding protein [Arthrobacter]NYG18532.1 oligopeptide transport system substrate-binding protein [Arthrobacter psychrochitiniphilus]PXA64343.1 ABC transporter substrate-binding protein [Arthrobacter psychrochitiniphilus]
MRFTRTYKALGVAAVLALSLSACGGGSSNDSTDGSNAGGDTTKVITANTTEPGNGLLPANTNEVGGGRVMDLIFSGLVSYDADGAIVNELAESIETKDSQNYTIKLKSGETFSDGSAITAASFVDAWNFGAAAKNAQLNSYFFESIKGYDKVSAEGSTEDKMEGLKVVDDTTFTVELAQPESDFQLRLGYTAFYPLPATAYDNTKSFGENPVGNGPYKLAADGWKHEISITLVPNEKYNGPRKAKNGGVTFKIFNNMDSAYTEVQSNNLDILDQVPPSGLQNFKTDFDGRNVNQPYAGNATMTIPSYLPEFQGEAGQMRRQAISMAIDRQQIIDKIFYGNKKVAADFTSPVLDGYNASLPGADVLKFDAAKAKAMWEKADAISPWPAGKVFTISSNIDGAGNKEYITAMANQISTNLGIKAELNPIATFKEMRALVNSKKLTGASRAGWQADYPSLYNFLGPLYGTGAGSNDGNYSNPAFDAKLKEGLSATSVEAGNKLFNESQEILLKDLPVVPLWYQAVQGVWSENVNTVPFGWNGVPLYYEVTAK